MATTPPAEARHHGQPIRRAIPVATAALSGGS
jgi:hypothetical protein